MGNTTAVFQPLPDVSGSVDRTKEPTLRSAGKGGGGSSVDVALFITTF